MKPLMPPPPPPMPSAPPSLRWISTTPISASGEQHVDDEQNEFHQVNRNGGRPAAPLGGGGGACWRIRPFM